MVFLRAVALVALVVLVHIPVYAQQLDGSGVRINNTTTATVGFAEQSTDPAKAEISSLSSGQGNGLKIFNNANAPMLFGTNGTEAMRILAGGSVAIGTTSPAAGKKLHVVGDSQFDAPLTLHSSTQLTPRVILTGQEYFQAGQTSTDGLALVLGVNRANNRQLWIMDSTQLATPNATNSGIRFVLSSGLALVSAVATNGNVEKPLILNAMTFANGGAGVAIGTTVPSAGAKLTVDGNAVFTGTVSGGNIQAHYQDLAEWVPSNSDLEAGTVVVLDPEIGNGIKASGGAYDTTVAGVVSAQPGIILGEAGSSKEQIATTGRVRVKVDASRGAIAVGDLLVTSDKPGYAMRSAPIEIGGAHIHRPGTIVGKALEALTTGEGEILVLLSLQ